MTRSTNSRKLRIESLEVRNLLAVVAGGTEEVTLSPDPTEATTWVVNTTDDPVAGNPYDSILSLREAIERAATGDRIVFGSSLIGKTITFSDDMNTEGYYIGNGITIDASSIGGITIVADGRVQVFGVTGGNSSNPVELINLTISGGHLTDNYCGGGINNHGTLILTNCTISGNSADQGGGIYNCGTLKLTDCTISGNSARSGAGIYNDYDGTLAITNCTISENSARSGGGVCNFGSLTIVNSAIERNTVDDSGGGIENGGTVILNNCTILGNSADKGGGIHNSIQGTLTVTNSAINGNTANGYGGGIYNYYQTKKLNFVNCSIFGNTARYDGGGFYGKQNLETSMFVNCAISGNTAGRYGGGVYNFGYANDPSAPLRFINCTITGNTSDQGGGICNNKNDTLTLTNTILSLNYANAYNDIYSIRSVSSSFNIIGPDPGFVVAPIFEDGKVINMDELDLTLTACSVAIDAGNNDVVTTETDLAGNKRIVNSIIDLGAFEYLKPSITDVSIAGWSGSYDGMAHSITVDDPDASTDTILYSTDGTTYDLTQIPQYTDVGTYTTYVMVSRSGYQDWYGSATVEIIPAIINDVTLTGWSGDHDSLAHSITVSDPHDATDTILYSTDGVNYNLTTCPEYFDEGTYTTYVRVIRRGYAHWEGSASVEIRHVSPIVTTLEDLVDNRDGKTSLREAIGLAIEGDLITFDTNLSGGTILLNGTQLEITKSISIDASSIGGVTINANEKSRVFYIHMSDGSDKDITLSGLTIKGGMNVDKGGGIYNQNSTLTLTNSIVSGNTANDNGGGFYNADGCILTLSNSTVSGNTAYGSGGGIYNSGTFNLYNSIIAENIAISSDDDICQISDYVYAFNTLSSFIDWTESGDCLVYDPTLPLFTDPEKDDFTLAPESQAYNVGNNSYVTTEVDLAGNRRICSRIVDLGAYEFQLTETPSTVVTTLEDVVDETDGLISLREAISYAKNGDVISFDFSLAGGTITLNGTQLEIAAAVTIDASDVGGVTIDANGKSRVFSISGGTTEIPVELINLTITGGNDAKGYGGGIYIEYGTLTMTNCTVSENSTNSSGGGICNNGGTLILTNSTISTNTAGEGGGILNNNGILTLAHCSIVKNIAYQKAGGGILNWGDSFLHLTNCLVSENYCYGEYGGGGIYNNEGTVTITKTIISENFTNKNSGGGISNSRGTMVLDGCTISNNTSSGFGGFGGGITNGGTMSISNCVVSGNTAEASFYGGGGIFNAKDLIMTNTVVSGNKAKLCGGGLYLISRGSNDSILINCTVTDNTAEGGGDGIAVVGTVCYYNSIIVQNGVSDVVDDSSFEHPSVFYAYNTLSSFTDWTESADCLVYNPSLPLFTDPENGDYTLVKNSQCVNVGSNDYVTTKTDLAGSPRIVDGIVDLGAYEYHEIHLNAPSILTGNNGIYASYGANRHQIQWDVIDNASGYELQYSADGSRWTTVYVAETTAVITGLTYGDEVSYRVRALGEGSYADSEWSEGKTFAVCPMDVNGDGDIGGIDRVILAQSWLAEEGEDDYIPAADIDGNGDVGGIDRAFLANNWLNEVGVDEMIYPRPQAADVVFSEFASVDLAVDLDVF
jgi:hypothetical protein